MADYKTFVGVVAFDPDEVDIQGRPCRRVTMNLANNSNDTRVSITLWDEMKDVAVNRGDVLIVEGAYKQNESNGKVYHNVNAARIAVLPTFSATKSEGTTKPATKKPTVDF